MLLQFYHKHHPLSSINTYVIFVNMYFFWSLCSCHPAFIPSSTVQLASITHFPYKQSATDTLYLLIFSNRRSLILSAPFSSLPYEYYFACSSR